MSEGDDEPIAERDDSTTLYVDVDGTTVELSVAATSFHGDGWWDAWYYVDERVVRRTTDEDADPRDGELLECRGTRLTRPPAFHGHGGTVSRRRW